MKRSRFCISPIPPKRPDPLRRALLKSAGLAAAALVLDPRAAGAAPPVDSDVLDVVIIGAGLAGLTTARDLARAGNRSFVVLEARGRVGGRTLNHRLRDGCVSEAGGQWIGPGQTAVADLARELEIGTFASDYVGRSVYRNGKGRVSVHTEGSFEADRRIIEELQALAATLPASKPWTAARASEFDRISMAGWLAARDVDSIELLTWQVASVLTMGVAPAQVSLLQYLTMLRFAGSVGGLEGQKHAAQEQRFFGGSQALSIQMAAELGARVLLEHPVTEIRGWHRKVVEVVTPRKVLRARSVVVALSPPLCNQIAFRPALPAPRRELQRRWPAHAPQMKAAVVYPSAFWFADGFNGQIGSVGGSVIWSYDNSPPDRRFGVLNAFLRAAEMPTDPELAKAAVVEVFADSFGDRRYREPLEFHVQDWGQEPYTLTCVSPMPPGLLTSGLMPALTEPVGRLIWSGTETADIWKGYMDGAVRSGHRAALSALQSLRSVQSC